MARSSLFYIHNSARFQNITRQFGLLFTSSERCSVWSLQRSSSKSLSLKIHFKPKNKFSAMMPLSDPEGRGDSPLTKPLCFTKTHILNHNNFQWHPILFFADYLPCFHEQQNEPSSSLVCLYISPERCCLLSKRTGPSPRSSLTPPKKYFLQSKNMFLT